MAGRRWLVEVARGGYSGLSEQSGYSRVRPVAAAHQRGSGLAWRRAWGSWR
jgi:hypothetical protein